MPEAGGANIEIALQLDEATAQQQPSNVSNLHQVLEVVEAIILAMVAIAAAWSSYQAARWDGAQFKLYGLSSRLRVEAQTLELEVNQERLYNAATVAEWLKAEAHGETELASLFERRLLPEFRVAFEAWKKTDPVHNAQAPPSPMAMPAYRNAKAEAAAQKNREATELFEPGTRARGHADDYVRVTVFLATALLLTAISQRFHSRQIRIALVALAFLMLSIPIWRLIGLPRA